MSRTPQIARYGVHLQPGVVLMPGYVNVGAHVGAGALGDTRAFPAGTYHLARAEVSFDRGDGLLVVAVEHSLHSNGLSTLCAHLRVVEEDDFGWLDLK